MKIGNQVITGMYVYNPDYEYTINDFVVYEGVIYTCVKDAIGEVPGESDSYVVYLGDRGHSIDPQGYLNFLETSEGENKYISVGMLQAIMSYYMLGPTGKGIIGDYVCYDSENLMVSLKLGDKGDFTNPDTVISDIMYHPDINHALLRVSRLLPEICGYVGIKGISEYSGEDQKSVLLRQYTYLQEDTGEKIRLQELIDPVDGVIWYRSGNLDTALQSSSGSWKCSVVNSRALKSRVEDLIGLYTTRLKVIKSLETNIKSNFRYRKLDLPSSGVTRPTLFSFNTDLEAPEITLTVSEIDSSGFIKNYETTINLGDKINGDIPLYLVGTDYLVKSVQKEGGYQIELLKKDTKIYPENAWLSGAYYKEYYGLS